MQSGSTPPLLPPTSSSCPAIRAPIAASSLPSRRVIDNNLADVMSMSYSEGEQFYTSSDYTFQDNLYAQAAAQGQSIVISSGDSGSDVADQGQGLATSGINVSAFGAPTGHRRRWHRLPGRLRRSRRVARRRALTGDLRTPLTTPMRSVMFLKPYGTTVARAAFAQNTQAITRESATASPVTPPTTVSITSRPVRVAPARIMRRPRGKAASPATLRCARNPTSPVSPRPATRPSQAGAMRCCSAIRTTRNTTAPLRPASVRAEAHPSSPLTWPVSLVCLEPQPVPVRACSIPLFMPSPWRNISRPQQQRPVMPTAKPRIPASPPAFPQQPASSTTSPPATTMFPVR